MNRAASTWTARSWIPSGEPKQSDLAKNRQNAQNPSISHLITTLEKMARGWLAGKGAYFIRQPRLRSVHIFVWASIVCGLNTRQLPGYSEFASTSDSVSPVHLVSIVRRLLHFPAIDGVCNNHRLRAIFRVVSDIHRSPYQSRVELIQTSIWIPNDKRSALPGTVDLVQIGTDVVPPMTSVIPSGARQDLRRCTLPRIRT